ncbi:MAG: NADH-quinone oxidoreductase subunit H [Proteobacteria bacterium]|nr:NADH-quinone oxidoreductase subunit H [Pseudomonadota bacterium]MBU1710910.1 NADH-quinone oxidoreductase subunit H [Pseudomonadota bacterium]
MMESLAIHLLLLFGLSPLLSGIIAKTKALIAGRQGPPVTQLYLDLWKLFRKDMVISRTTTWIFRAGPVVGFTVPVLAAMLVPFGATAAPLSFPGDPILFIYLLAVARFFTILAALDTGSSFEHMGAAREATFSVLVEPTVFVAFIVLIRVSGAFSLNNMFGAVTTGWLLFSPAGFSLAIIACCLFIVLLVENCRIPFDDPNTHLELTMIHEVMILDHSGSDYGLILYGAAMKLLLSGTLILNLLLPFQGPLILDMLIFCGGIAALAVLVGLVESAMARLRLLRLPQLLIGTTLLSFFALILLLR